MKARENPIYFVHAVCEDCKGSEELLTNRITGNLKCAKCIEIIFKEASEEYDRHYNQFLQERAE